MLDVLVVFFFKQKTAYEMRISDWSSDVCSSDLTGTTPISEDFDLQRFAAESLGSYAGGGIAWGASGQAATPLGTADYRHFSFSRISCVAFQTPYGGAVYGHPVNVLKGLYCDPAVPQIPQFDLDATLAAHRVVPEVGPGVSPAVRADVQPVWE